MNGSSDGTSQTTPVNVLVVDDRPDNRKSLRAILSSPEYRIVEAGSGFEALLRLLEEEFAVLLIDVVMPGMDGFELARAIRARDRTATIPIVFLTAQAADVELIAKGYQGGAADYLVKPLIPEMVRAKVAVFSQLYRQRKRIEQQSTLLLEAEQKENELRITQLQLSADRRYRSLTEAIPTIIWTAHPEGLVDYFNRQWYEFTGLSAEATGGSWYSALHPEDRPRCDVAWQEACRLAHPCQLEVRLRRKDGEYRWHLGRAIPERGSDGSILSWFGTFTDIEDQKRAQSILAEFRGTLDALLDAVLIFEPDTMQFRYVNQGAEVLLGYPRQQLTRMRPFEFMKEYDEDSFRQLLAPLADGRKTVIAIDSRCRRRDGSDIPVEFSFQLVHTNGGHVVSIARDITDRKLAELEREQLYAEALAAIRARDDFLSVASHELTTPLSSLQLQMEMLIRPPGGAKAGLSPEQVKEKLESAWRQIDRLSRLLGELLDVTRITAGQMLIEPERVDLARIASDVVFRYKEDAAKARCEVTVHADRAVIGKWDRLRMEQVMTNLLTNAFKFGAGKPVDVFVGEEDGTAHLVVRDQGIGIPPEDIERVFERFERASSARGYSGLGLGLYIVHQIIDAHGGTIRVESQSGAGSTFTVDLPLETPVKSVDEGKAEEAADHPSTPAM